jgi:hypothetical protein
MIIISCIIIIIPRRGIVKENEKNIFARVCSAAKIMPSHAVQGFNANRLPWRLVKAFFRIVTTAKKSAWHL